MSLDEVGLRRAFEDQKVICPACEARTYNKRGICRICGIQRFDNWNEFRSYQLGQMVANRDKENSKKDGPNRGR